VQNNSGTFQKYGGHSRSAEESRKWHTHITKEIISSKFGN
jgi:hypothetical protein